MTGSDKTAPDFAARRRKTTPLPAFTMAFQPIVHATGIFAHEALVRGSRGESAESIFNKLDATNLYSFDQACRIRAIEMAAELSQHPPCISINFVPGAIYQPETCIQHTMAAAEQVGLPLSKIIFEVSEGEKVTDRQRLVSIFREYRRHGLKTAIDDFGAGYSGLDLLSEFQPEIIKLDIALIRDIHLRPASQAIVRSIASLCRELDILSIAEGVESDAELQVLQDLGLELFQGYLFARPSLESFAQARLPLEHTPPQIPGLALAALHSRSGVPKAQAPGSLPLSASLARS
jgi:EAL domain-containing protein (putative c-di-GMP-specific phosphodiesterase class I)